MAARAAHLRVGFIDYMLQEMHLEGNFIKTLPTGHFLIHHGPNMQSCQDAKGGIVIILSPEMAENLKRGGSIIQHGGTTFSKTTRLLSIDVELKMLVKLKAKTKLRHKCISLWTSYHPTSGYSDKEVTKFNNEVSKMINSLPKDNVLIMGANLNASISMRASKTSKTNESSKDEDPSASLLGPHSNARRNTRGNSSLGWWIISN